MARGARKRPPWEAAAPLRSAWAWWAESAGAALAHAAAVGEASGGILLAGPGGSGKSTTALACLRDGMRFAGDDYVLVRADPPWVFGLFPTASPRTCAPGSPGSSRWRDRTTPGTPSASS